MFTHFSRDRVRNSFMRIRSAILEEGLAMANRVTEPISA
jgi:hypothetical protein